MRSASIRTAVMAAGVALASQAHASILSDWNLFVYGNLNSSQEVEGRALIGGNLSGGAQQYGTMLTPRPNYLGTDVLAVGGNINVSNLHVEAGNLRLGGTRSGTVDFNGGGHQINDPNTFLIAQAAQAEIVATSSYLHGLASTNTVTLPSGQPAGVTFNAVPNSDGVAVFNVDGNSLFHSNLVQSINLSLNSADSVIINVSGTSISFDGGNMIGGMNAANAGKILWNFYEATSISIDRQFFGALVAPGATLSNSTVIVGSTAVANFNQNGEVHIPTYTGFVPAPGAAGLTLAAGLFAARRRRR